MHKLPLLSALPVPAQAYSANPRRTQTSVKMACPLTAAALPGHRCWPHTTLRLPTRQGPLTQASSQKGTHRTALQAAREAGHAGLWAASLPAGWSVKGETAQTQSARVCHLLLCAVSPFIIMHQLNPCKVGVPAHAKGESLQIQFLAVELHSETQCISEPASTS